MPTATVAISKAFQGVMQHHLTQLDRSRLAKECAKLHPPEEQLFAEEGRDSCGAPVTP
jgi:hypothetical protein